MSSRRRGRPSVPGSITALGVQLLANLSADGRTRRSPAGPTVAPPAVREPRPADDGGGSTPDAAGDAADGPLRRFEVGVGGYSEVVRVRNDADDARAVRVVVAARDSVLVDSTDELPAGGYLDVAFRARDSYEVTVRFDGEAETVELPLDRFDGTDTRTNVDVNERRAEVWTTVAGGPAAR